MQIGGLNVERNTKTQGTLDAGFYFPEAPKNYIRRVAQIPYTVICGRNDGPTLCVSAGNDPTEYAAIGAAIKLAIEINPDTLARTLIVVHVANIVAFWEKKYIGSLDQVQLTGAYPGKSNGTVTEVIAYHIFKDLICKAQFYIDLHGGDTHELQMGRSYFYRIGNQEIDIQTEKMAKVLGHKYVIPWSGGKISKDGPGESIEIAALHGIPAAISELGSGDIFSEEEISAQFKGILGVMQHLGMIDVDIIPNESQKIINDVIRFTSSHSGLFYSRVKPGDTLSVDQIFGEVKNLHGEIIEVIRAPKIGVVLSMIRNPVVDQGELVILDFGLL